MDNQDSKRPGPRSVRLALTGKVALLTGSARGVGRASAPALCALGTKVVINYATSEERAQKTVARIQHDGQRLRRRNFTKGAQHGSI